MLFFKFNADFSIKFAVKNKKIIERKIFVLYINICAPHMRGTSLQLNNEAWLSLVERCVRDAEVAGSNPVASIMRRADLIYEIGLVLFFLSRKRIYRICGGKYMKQFVNIVLASGSPRRKELFGQAGIDFTVIKSDAEEKITNTVPDKAVMELATQKAEAVKKELLDKELRYKELSNGEILIVGADTVVVSGGKILGKPQNEKDALDILMSLSGKNHSVYTGVCGIYLDKEGKVREEKCICFAEETVVTMYPFMEEEARAYIKTKEPMDKAGAYGIQGIGALLVQGIQGDYNNVVGFPLAAFFRLGCQKNFFRL